MNEMRSKEELKMDATIDFMRLLAFRIGAYPKHKLITRIEYKLVADTNDLADFLYCVEKLLDELTALAPPPKVNPDQLTLF